jgi:hypothetical protein
MNYNGDGLFPEADYHPFIPLTVLEHFDWSTTDSELAEYAGFVVNRTLY